MQNCAGKRGVLWESCNSQYRPLLKSAQGLFKTCSSLKFIRAGLNYVQENDLLQYFILLRD